jgi:hypothetical protein
MNLRNAPKWLDAAQVVGIGPLDNVPNGTLEYAAGPLEFL